MNIEDYYMNGYDDETDPMGAERCLEAIEDVVDSYLDEEVAMGEEDLESGNALMDHLLSELSEAGAAGEFELDIDELQGEMGELLGEYDDLGEEGLGQAA